MSGLVTEGQARLAPVASAVTALLQGHDVDVDALLPAWRALAPACHPLANADVVDVAALTAVLARRPGLLGGGDDVGDGRGVVDVVDDDPRGGRPAAAVARALADALTVTLESRKIGFGMAAPPAALREAFSDPATARDVLSAVRDLAGVTIATTTSSQESATAALTAALSATASPGRPVHIVAGAGVRRILDVLSPYCRRLRVDLALAGRAPGAVADDDDAYRGLDRLVRAAAGTVTERRAADADEGFVDTNAGFVIDAARLVEDHVDRRARGLVAALKRARVVVVGVVDEAACAALDVVPASTRVLAAGTADGALFALLDAATGAVLPLLDVDHDADVTTSLSLPWRGLAPAAVQIGVDEGAYAAAQALWRRRLDDPRWPLPAVVVADDASRAALQALASMVPATPDRRR
jgi:hypothetical protein